MTTFFRRAKVVVARIVSLAADPSAIATAPQLYALVVAGVKQLMARDSAGELYQVTPIFGPCRMSFYYCDDFLATVNSNSVVSGGTTTFTTTLSGAPGIARQTVTTLAVDRTTMFPATTTNSTVVVGGNPYFFEGRCRTVTVQDGTDQWTDRWGLGDGLTNNDSTDGCYFESDRAAYGDNNVRLCAANGGTRTKTSMGVAPTANTFERWKLIVNAAGDSIQGYLNDTATGSAVTTNIPTGNATGMWWGQLLKTLGVSARNVDRDYFESYQVFSTPR